MEEAQVGIKIAGRNINNLRYADGTQFSAMNICSLHMERRHSNVGDDTSWDKISLLDP